MDYFSLDFIIFMSVGAIFFHFIKNDNFKKKYLLVLSFIFLFSWSYWAPLMLIIDSLIILALIKNTYRNKVNLFIGLIYQVILLLFSKILISNNMAPAYELKFVTNFAFVGVAYYSLQNISTLVDTYFDNKIKYNFYEILFNNIFFLKILLGPIERVKAFSRQEFHFSEKKMWDAVFLISFAFFKKMVVLPRLLIFNKSISSLEHNQLGIGTYWLISILSFFAMYADFSAYVDFCRGGVKLFCLELSENFNKPYLADGPADYWKRWHITLSSWMKEYIYYPSLLYLKNPFFSLIITFAIVGIWHSVYVELMYWSMAWVIYYIIDYKLNIKKHLKIHRYIKQFVNLTLISSFGMHSYYSMFYKKLSIDYHLILKLSEWKIIYNNLPMFFVLIVLLISDWYKSKNYGRWSKIIYSSLLIFLTALLMINSSYLFYYMRL